MSTEDRIWGAIISTICMGIVTLVHFWQMGSRVDRPPGKQTPSPPNAEVMAEMDRWMHQPTTSPNDKPAAIQPPSKAPATQPAMPSDKLFGLYPPDNFFRPKKVQPALRTGPPVRQPPTTQMAKWAVSFFGITDHAAKVAYVVSESGGMFETFAYVRTELARSVNALEARQSFRPIFFAGARPTELTIDGWTDFFPATAQNKKAAKEWIDSQIARLTADMPDARPAIERAFQAAGGPPDVLFLLTDWQFPDGTPDLIAKLNADHKVRVHTIAFRDRAGEPQLQKIAQQNRGQYRFVADAELDEIAPPGPSQAPAGTQPQGSAPATQSAGPAGNASVTKAQANAPAAPATQPAVSFYGITDHAAKVAYVVDKSGSMFDTLDYIKAELARSINALGPGQSFFPVFFDSGFPTELKVDGAGGFLPATPANKKAAKSWIDDQIARSMTGQVRPEPAIERAFAAAGGPPDVLFFLTDGLFPEQLVDRIRKLNADHKVRVHTIGFRDRIGELLLKKIAEQNGGKYGFIAESALGVEPLTTQPALPEVTFFGLQNRHSNTQVVYVVDRSAAMGSMFDPVRRELIRSIRVLDERQEFQIFLFADTAAITLEIAGSAKLHKATEANKEAAIGWLNEQKPQSRGEKADAAEALRHAAGRVRDWDHVIFLLAGSPLADNPAKSVRENREIHTIAVGSREAEGVLKQVGNGQHKFISKEELERRY